MKRHVKGRSDPKFISPFQLASESGESFGLVFNVIDGRASSSLNSGRFGATWCKGQRGQLVGYLLISIWNPSILLQG